MNDGDPHKGSKIGRTLELARKERGLSFKQVEEATKIRAGYLEELERENFDVLPAVYVQGSLKTYANFLQLDGEALVQELKRRQASRREPAYVDPRNDASDLPTIPLAAAAVVDSSEAMEDEDDAGWTLFPAGINRYLYLGVAAFLVLVAVVLAFIGLAGDRPPAVSQVREPLISQAPPEPAPVESKEDDSLQPRPKEENRGTKDEDDGPQHERAAGPPDKDTGGGGVDQTAQTGQDDSRPAEDSSDTATTESAPATVEPETTAPATAEPETASTPPAAAEPAQRRSPGGPRRSPPGSRDGGEFDVRITAGSDDPVRITGGVPGD